MTLCTNEVGALAELRFQVRCAERGIPCFAPIIPTNKAIDLVIDLDGRYVSVQIKSAAIRQFDSWGKSPRIMACLHGSAKRAYKTADPDYRKKVDYYAFVCGELNSIWLVPEADLEVKQTWGVKLDEVDTLKAYLF